MIKSLKFLLKSQLKTAIKIKKNRGFTLIELLVGLILAVLIIVPMLTFVTGLLDTDNKEQAKATTEQELNSAIDYINKDLQQAFYIYGPVSTTDARPFISAQLPSVSGATVTNGVSGCNTGATNNQCTPIIAFWKKKFVEKSIPINTTATDNHDGFVDSLVVYYYIKDSSATWSKSGRIARFEIQDGVKGFTGSYVSPNDATTGRPTSGSATETSRDLGFESYTTKIATAGSTIDKDTIMNSWTKKTSENYNNPVLVLIDNIESFTFTKNTDGSAIINMIGNSLARLNSTPPSCTTDSIYCPKASLRLNNIGFIKIEKSQ